MSQSLLHDCAFVLTHNVMVVTDPEGDYREAFLRLYEIIKAGLECYETKRGRGDSRLDPGRN